jgi:hypothetical protein
MSNHHMHWDAATLLSVCVSQPTLTVSHSVKPLNKSNYIKELSQTGKEITKKADSLTFEDMWYGWLVGNTAASTA